MIILWNQLSYRLRLRKGVYVCKLSVQGSAWGSDSHNAKTTTHLSKTVLNAAIKRRNEGAIEQRLTLQRQRRLFLRRLHFCVLRRRRNSRVDLQSDERS